MPLDKFPLIIKEFKGLLLSDIDPVLTSSGEFRQISIPFEYALKSQNLEYLQKGGMRTRNGIDRYVEQLNVTGKPRQIWKIDILNGVPQVDRWLILTWDGGSGRLYDTQVAGPATNPILTVANMRYAYCLNAFGRIYITPWSAYTTPLTGAAGIVYVYNGLYNARATRGLEPVPGAFAAAAAAAGNCTAGLHLATVVYETDTGYRTPIPVGHLPAAPITVTTTAANATINFTGIPTGPTGTVARHILLTKVVVNYNGQSFYSYEPFICLTIGDNTTTTGSFNRPDSSLVDSAAELVNETSGAGIPGHISLAVYGNRLVYISRKPITTPDLIGAAHTVTFSPPNRPEQLGNTETNPTARIKVGPEYSGKCITGVELNKVFYVFKEDSTFGIVADDETDPIEWEEPKLVDGGKGAFPFGIAKIGENPGLTQDGMILVAGNHGITLFDGKFAQNSIADSIWNLININDIKWIKLLSDPIRKNLFIKIGDPAENVLASFGNPANDTIFVANYYYGFGVDTLRWGTFKFTNCPSTDGMFINDFDLRQSGTSGGVGPGGVFNTLYPLLVILNNQFNNPNYDSYLYSEALQCTDFDSLSSRAFPLWIYETGYTPNKQGEIYTFGPLKLRAQIVKAVTLPNDTGSIIIEACGLDSSTYKAISTIRPGELPGKYISINLNFKGEHMRLRLYGSNRVLVQALILHSVVTAVDQPRV